MIEKCVLSMGGNYGEIYEIPDAMTAEQVSNFMMALSNILDGKKKVSLIVDYEKEPEPMTESEPESGRISETEL